MAKKPAPAHPSDRNPTNRLISPLARIARQRILAVCDTVALNTGDILHEPGRIIAHVYFPTEGYISVMIPVDNGSILEVGLIGDEGMFGLPLLLGVDTSPLRALVQGTGMAWRMAADAFREEIERNPKWRTVLMRYVQVSFSQLAQTAACTRFHVVEHRLARWLLMTQDRAHRDDFRVTQEFLAYMLGVRRVGVTKAALALQGQNLIRYHRGEVTVIDRAGLESAACSCYQIDRDAYDRLLPAPPRKASRAAGPPTV
jgi:CRP-like cAMP-binding protein